jgi:hypothetical protein
VNPVKRRLLRVFPPNYENDNSTETSADILESNENVSNKYLYLVLLTNNPFFIRRTVSTGNQ